MKTVPVQTEADLEKAIGPASTFRGQRDATWPLRSTLERAAEKRFGDKFREHLADFEALMIDQFIDRCDRCELNELYSPHVLPDASDAFQWLSLMQHYGHPTRLIDFTDDLWVALCFALRNARAGDAFAVYQLQMLPGDEAGNQLPKDANGRNYRVPRANNRPNVSELLGKAINFRHFQSRKFRYDEAPLGQEWSRPTQNYGWDTPAVQNARIRRQRGRFMYQVILDGRIEETEELTKYTFSAGLQGAVRSKLHSLGVKYTEDFLFPSFEEKT